MTETLEQTYKITGERIKHYRKQKQMTMKRLGELVGLHESTISRYEKGEIQSLDIEKLKQFAKALDIDPLCLIEFKFGEKGSPAIKLHDATRLDVDELNCNKWAEKYKDVNFTQEEIDSLFDYADFLLARRKK